MVAVASFETEKSTHGFVIRCRKYVLTSLRFSRVSTTFKETLKLEPDNIVLTQTVAGLGLAGLFHFVIKSWTPPRLDRHYVILSVQAVN